MRMAPKPLAGTIRSRNEWPKVSIGRRSTSECVIRGSGAPEYGTSSSSHRARRWREDSRCRLQHRSFHSPERITVVSPAGAVVGIGRSQASLNYAAAQASPNRTLLAAGAQNLRLADDSLTRWYLVLFSTTSRSNIAAMPSARCFASCRPAGGWSSPRSAPRAFRI